MEKNLIPNVLSIIEVAVARGAYRADEIQTVGAIYDTLKSLMEEPADEEKVEDAE